MKKLVKTYIPLILGVLLGIFALIQRSEFISWDNMLLNYGSAALTVLAFSGICAFLGKSKKGKIGGFLCGLAFSAAMIFAGAPIINGTVYGNTGNEFVISAFLWPVIILSAIILIVYYIKNKDEIGKGASIMFSALSVIISVVLLLNINIPTMVLVSDDEYTDGVNADMQAIENFGGEEAFFTEWNETDVYSDEAAITIEKSPEKDFVILNLTDIQLRLGQWELKNGKIAVDTITKLVNEINPDLITLTGDNAWSVGTYVETVKFIDSLGIPWAPVMGNHDGEDITGGELWCAYQFEKAENCLWKFGPEDMGYGNYIINIEENGKVIHTLFMLDSHNRKDYDIDGETVSGYDHLWDNQIKWYEWAVKGIEKEAGNKVESTVFMHIPVPQYITAWDAVCGEFGDETGIAPESYGTELKTEDGHTVTAKWGKRTEQCCPPPVDNGFFDIVKELGSTKTMVAGHDHINDFAVEYDGITLAYGVKTGPGCYWDEAMNGGTTITVTSDGKAELKNIYIEPDEDLLKDNVIGYEK